MWSVTELRLAEDNYAHIHVALAWYSYYSAVLTVTYAYKLRVQYLSDARYDRCTFCVHVQPRLSPRVNAFTSPHTFVWTAQMRSMATQSIRLNTQTCSAECANVFITCIRYTRILHLNGTVH